MRVRVSLASRRRRKDRRARLGEFGVIEFYLKNSSSLQGIIFMVGKKFKKSGRRDGPIGQLERVAEEFPEFRMVRWKFLRDRGELNGRSYCLHRLQLLIWLQGSIEEILKKMRCP